LWAQTIPEKHSRPIGIEEKGWSFLFAPATRQE